jgi:ABC-type nitrate/sulfonate/bicarbonate transport system substrate-binding protein
LESGAVDAAANLEPVYSSNPEPYDVLFWANEHVPAFQQTVIITGQQFLEDQPELVAGFLRARAKAIDWIKQNPDEAAAMWAEEADIDESVARDSLTTVLKDDYYGVGFSAEGLSAVDHEMELIDLVPEGTDVPWEDLIDNGQLPDGTASVDPADIGKDR